MKSNFNTPQESPGFLLWQVTNSWQRLIRKTLGELELTHVQFVLLAACAWLSNKENQPITQVSLATFTKIDVMMASKVIRTLERKGLVIRKEHPTDTRAKVIAITPTGLEKSKQALVLVEKADADFFAVLGPGLDQFILDLNKLTHNSN